MLVMDYMFRRWEVLMYTYNFIHHLTTYIHIPTTDFILYYHPITTTILSHHNHHPIPSQPPSHSTTTTAKPPTKASWTPWCTANCPAASSKRFFTHIYIHFLNIHFHILSFCRLFFIIFYFLLYVYFKVDNY